jgi:hypothetical protein
MRRRISLFSLIFTEIGTLIPPAKKTPNSAARPAERRKPATSRASSSTWRNVASFQPSG